MRIVVNFEIKRFIFYIYYVGFSRVIVIEGLYIINLCEDKIFVSLVVEKEMLRFRGEGKFDFCFFFIYIVLELFIKLFFLNVCLLYKYINDVFVDRNYLSIDICVFLEIRFNGFDSDIVYKIGEYILFRNDVVS